MLARLDVAVDQPPTVSVVQCVGNRGDQVGGKSRNRRSTFANPDREIVAFEELRHDESKVRLQCDRRRNTGTISGWSSLARMRASAKNASTMFGVGDTATGLEL